MKNENYNDLEESLRLGNVAVLRIGENDSYMVTLSNEEEKDERVLLNGKEEKTVVEECIINAVETETHPISYYMPSDYVELYEQVLSEGDYECCMKILMTIENYLNNKYKKHKAMVLKR